MEPIGRATPRREATYKIGGRGRGAAVAAAAEQQQQVSERGYDGSSEETLRQHTNTRFDRRRSRSWLRRFQHLERLASGPQSGLLPPPVCRGKRWRRRKMQKRARAFDNTIKAPAASPVTASTNSNHSNEANKCEFRPQCPTPIPSNSSPEKDPHQHQQHQQQQQRPEQRQPQPEQTWKQDANKVVQEKTVTKGVTDEVLKLTFQVQLAHGSPTGIISGFGSLPQLYEAIANCYDEITDQDILFCTVNTHRICMEALLCSNISVNDFIFAHIAGQKKEVTLVKTDTALGLTITDNGAGKAFIKRIVPNTVTANAKPVGDFIEKINGESMVGKRHFDVAKCLRTLPIGATFTMRLVEPKTSGFNFIASYSRPKYALAMLGERETIRFKADGTVVVQELPNALVINKMNDIFDSYFGFHDNDLAQTIWEMVAQCENFSDLTNILKKSEMKNFNFPQELYFDLWGAVDDYRSGRLGKTGQSRENKNATGACALATEGAKNPITQKNY